jgi:regulator of replication initiation timing
MKLSDKVDECIADARDLSKRIGKNFARICDHREEAGNDRQLLSSKINAVSERLDRTVKGLEGSLDQGDADYRNLDSRIKALESESPDSGLQDGNKRLLDEIASLRSDNERLRARLGNMQRCNSNQAKMIRNFRDRDRRVLDSCNLGNCVDAVELLKEINGELS